MPYIELRKNVYDCKKCPTRCDGKTVQQFDFERDVHFSEQIEKQVTQELNSKYPTLRASKTTEKGYPDIEIRKQDNSLLALVEIKGQARTFMAVQRLLPNAGLLPSETIALNLSDLERYFIIADQTKVPVILVWCLLQRPCITGSYADNRLFFHQKLEVLQKIRQADTNNNRRFRRESGRGDVVNGIHKGVVVNYHFSLNELEEGLPSFAGL
jgi:hypothetical protein